jgi:hypothetical protein
MADISLLDINNDDFNDWINITNQIIEVVNEIGDLSEVNATDKTSLVTVLNEIIAKIGNLNSLTTSQKLSLVAAVNQIDARFTPLVSSLVSLGNLGANRMLFTITNNTLSSILVPDYSRTFLGSSNYNEAMTNLGVSPFFSGALNQDAATGRAALGLAIGTNVQAFNSKLTGVSASNPAQNQVLVWDNGLGFQRSEYIFDYHQPTILAPATNTTYGFIDLQPAAQELLQLRAVTPVGTTADVNFLINGVTQMGTDLSVSSTVSIRTFSPIITIPQNAKVELRVNATSANVTRIQFCFACRAMFLSQLGL